MEHLLLCGLCNFSGAWLLRNYRENSSHHEDPEGHERKFYCLNLRALRVLRGESLLCVLCVLCGQSSTPVLEILRPRAQSTSRRCAAYAVSPRRRNHAA